MWLISPVIKGMQLPTTEGADTRRRDCGNLHSIAFVDTKRLLSCSYRCC